MHSYFHATYVQFPKANITVFQALVIMQATFQNKELLDTLTPASPYELPPEHQRTTTSKQDD
jgi:hypothetical protein